MSHLTEHTTPDDLLLLIAKHDGETRPRPWPEEPPLPEDADREARERRRAMLHAQSRRPPAQAPGFCHLNYTRNLHALYPRFVIQSQYQGFVVHLTWAGWDRVEALLAAGRRLPTDEEVSAYGRATAAAVQALPRDARELEARIELFPRPPRLSPRRLRSDPPRAPRYWILRAFGVR